MIEYSDEEDKPIIVEKCSEIDSSVNATEIIPSKVEGIDLAKKKERILGFDFARALAIFGMVIVNFKVVMGATENGPNWLIIFANLFDGRAAATFVILAGSGLALMTNKARLSNDREAIKKKRITLLKRAAFLFVIGLLYYIIWPADILHFYGIYLCVGVLFLTVASIWLWLGATIITGSFIVLFLLINYETGFNLETLDYVDFWTLKGFFRNLFYNGFHPVIPWVAFLLIGIWLGRCDLRDKRKRLTILSIALPIAIITELGSWLTIRFINNESLGLTQDDMQSIFGTNPMPPMPQYIVAGSATAISVIVLCVILTEKIQNKKIIMPFVYTGQLALTMYVVHVVLGMGILELFGILENRTLYFSVGYSFGFMIFAIVFSTLWRWKFDRGPLEWVMRKITG